MAYTNFPNAINPINFDPARSGAILNGSLGTLTAGQIGDTRIVVPLADLWDGDKYELSQIGPDVPELFLTFPVSVSISELFFDRVANENDAPAVWLYDASGDRYSGSESFEWGTGVSEVADLGEYVPAGQNRKVHSFDLTQVGTLPLTVKAIRLFGFSGYPQGAPKVVFGIYGTPAAEPPAPPPFWTNLLNSKQSAPV